MCPNNCGSSLPHGHRTIGQICNACEVRNAHRYLEQQPLTTQDWREIKILETKLRKLGML